MKKIFNLFFICGLFLNLIGCAFVPESIDLQPTVNTPASNIGEGKRVAVQVVDVRKQQDLGGRATYIGGAAGANIALADDPASSAQQVVFNSLKNYGFEPVDASNDPSCSRLLRISINDLNYKVIPHFANLDVVVNSVMDVNASNDGENYTKTYRKQKIHTVAVAPTTSQDEVYVNEVYSDVLKQLLTDKQLLNFLR